MKRTTRCVCGYKHTYDFDEKKIVEGDDDFVPVDVTVTVPNEWGPKISPQVYACPKCGTLKIETEMFSR